MAHRDPGDVVTTLRNHADGAYASMAQFCTRTGRLVRPEPDRWSMAGGEPGRSYSLPLRLPDNVSLQDVFSLDRVTAVNDLAEPVGIASRWLLPGITLEEPLFLSLEEDHPRPVDIGPLPAAVHPTEIAGRANTPVILGIQALLPVRDGLLRFCFANLEWELISLRHLNDAWHVHESGCGRAAPLLVQEPCARGGTITIASVCDWGCLLIDLRRGEEWSLSWPVAGAHSFWPPVLLAWPWMIVASRNGFVFAIDLAQRCIRKLGHPSDGCEQHTGRPVRLGPYVLFEEVRIDRASSPPGWSIRTGAVSHFDQGMPTLGFTGGAADHRSGRCDRK